MQFKSHQERALVYDIYYVCKLHWLIDNPRRIFHSFCHSAGSVPTFILYSWAELVFVCCCSFSSARPSAGCHFVVWRTTVRIPTLVTTSQDCEVFRSNLLYIANPDGDALRDHADTIVEGTKKLLLALHNPQVCHIAKVTPLVSTLSPSACHCCWDLGESLWMRPRGSLRRGSRLFFFYIRFISYINVWTFGFNDIICSVNCIQLIIRFYVVRIHSSWDKGDCY